MKIDASSSNSRSLSGQFLIWMPGMGDPRFDKSLIFLCDHSDDGAMGLIVNKPIIETDFAEICDFLDIDCPQDRDVPVLYGGPVDTQKGLVLHSPEFHSAKSNELTTSAYSLTGTRDVIEAMAKGAGPKSAFLAMGYAGWGAGQLEQELQQNAWLVGSCDHDLIFGEDHDLKWEMALIQAGVDPRLLQPSAGHA